MLTIDPIKQKQWRRDVRRFKYGIEVRLKLGILDGFRAKVYYERMNSKSKRPDWNDKYWQQLLCDCITCQSFPDEILLGITETAEFTYLRVEQPTPQEILKALDYTLRRYDTELRTLYGVYINEEKENTSGNKKAVPVI